MAITPNTSSLENSENTSTETTVNVSDPPERKNSDANMRDSENDAENPPDSQNSPSDTNQDIVDHDSFKQEWSCVRLEMQFNAIDDKHYKSLLKGSVTNNDIDNQKIALHPVITSIGKIIQECKRHDNDIDFKTSLTETLIDGGVLSRPWSNNEIKEHFNYSINKRDRNPDQRNLKVVLLMHYGKLKTAHNVKTEIFPFLTANKYFLNYHPHRFQPAETTIIGMFCNIHPAQSHITLLQSELYNVANEKYIKDKDRYTSRL